MSKLRMNWLSVPTQKAEFFQTPFGSHETFFIVSPSFQTFPTKQINFIVVPKLVELGSEPDSIICICAERFVEGSPQLIAIKIRISLIF